VKRRADIADAERVVARNLGGEPGLPGEPSYGTPVGAGDDRMLDVRRADARLLEGVGQGGMRERQVCGLTEPVLPYP
jgi:hypothetical protein